jgi:uncharacterized protein
MKMFSHKIAEQLKYYVYLYIDPGDGKTFYIGKGKGNRAFSLLKGIRDNEKIRTIKGIRSAGLEPRIELLKYGLTERQVLLLEATAIDLLHLKNLTNAARGHGTRFGARASVEEVTESLVWRAGDEQKAVNTTAFDLQLDSVQPRHAVPQARQDAR